MRRVKIKSNTPQPAAGWGGGGRDFNLYESFCVVEEHLFRQKGIAREVSEIRLCLDNGKEFERPSIHSMAEALIRFLESLIDPVFHYTYCNGFKDADLTQFCKDVISQMKFRQILFSFLRS